MKMMSIGKRILAASVFALALSSVAMATPKTTTVNVSEDELECWTISVYFFGIHLGDYDSCF